MWGGGVGQLPSAIFSTIRFVVPDYPFFGHRPFPGNGYSDAQTTILCPERMKPGVDPGLRTMRHDGRSERQYFRFLRELHIADIGPQPPADAELDRNDDDIVALQIIGSEAADEIEFADRKSTRLNSSH